MELYSRRLSSIFWLYQINYRISGISVKCIMSRNLFFQYLIVFCLCCFNRVYMKAMFTFLFIIQFVVLSDKCTQNSKHIHKSRMVEMFGFIKVYCQLQQDHMRQTQHTTNISIHVTHMYLENKFYLACQQRVWPQTSANNMPPETLVL
jgi:hypothetical protein